MIIKENIQQHDEESQLDQELAMLAQKHGLDIVPNTTVSTFVTIGSSSLSSSETTIRKLDRRQRREEHYSHDFITQPPSWIMRSGITAIAIVMAAILLASYFIKYPDKITASGILTATNPEIEHYPKINGIIDSIFTKDGAQTKVGDDLAYLQNETQVGDIHRLKEFIRRYEQIGHIPDYLHLKLPTQLQLGELQPLYSELILVYESYQSTLRQAGVFQQINTIKGEIDNTKRLEQVIQTDKALSAEELALIEKDFERQKQLNTQGVISDLDQEKSRGQLLQYQKSYNATDQSLITNKIRSKQLELEIQKLTEARAVQVNEHRYQLKALIQRITQAMTAWREQHYITSKIAGTVVLKSIMSDKRYITTSEVLATIIPYQKDEDKYAQVAVSSASVGKLEVGTRAIIKFDAYPYKQYGVLHTHVAKISQLPHKGKEDEPMYHIDLALPDSLVSSYRKTIPYKPQATIKVDLVTEDRSILQRIFNQFHDLIKNR